MSMDTDIKVNQLEHRIDYLQNRLLELEQNWSRLACESGMNVEYIKELHERVKALEGK